MSSFWGCTGKTYFNVVNRISSDVHLKYLAHYLFSALLDCYVSISRTICVLACLTVTLVSRTLFVLWFVWMLRWYLAHYLFSVCLIVTLVSRTLFVLWLVWLLHWYLAHYLFSVWLLRWYLAHYLFSVCLTVTLVSHALFVLWLVWLLR